jgi:hypothetical protein
MNIENRLSKLEAKTSTGDDFKVFRVIGETEEELQTGIDRLLASGEALPTDHFFCRLIVSPPIRDVAGSKPQGGKKKNQRAATATNLASGASGHPRTHHSTTTAPMPALPKMDLQRAAA